MRRESHEPVESTEPNEGRRSVFGLAIVLLLLALSLLAIPVLLHEMNRSDGPAQSHER